MGKNPKFTDSKSYWDYRRKKKNQKLLNQKMSKRQKKINRDDSQ